MEIIKKLFLIAASISILSSCSNDEESVNTDDVKVGFTIGLSSGSSVTRATLSNLFPESGMVKWNNSDKVSVFASGHINEKGDVFDFQKFIPEATANDAWFEGLSYKNASPYYILYPAQSSARLTEDGIKFNIPNVQKATKGSFDPAAGIQIGKGDLKSDHIGLKNVCAYFYLTVQDNCEYVRITATNPDWHLAGTCTAGITDTGSGGVLIKGFEDDCTHEITLTGFTGAGTYFIAFIPSSTAHTDFNLTVGYDQSADNGGVLNYIIESKNDYNFISSHCYELGSF